MKKRKILLAVVIVAVLVSMTVIVASADYELVRVTGSSNYPYDGTGWAWARLNFTFDPVTYEADGRFQYQSTDNEEPRDFFRWSAKVVCASLGEYEGMPAVSLVIEAIEGRTPGYYAKFMVADGGQNASKDMYGLTVWDMENGVVPDMPSCEFELPFYTWAGENGNVDIHLP